MFVVELCDMIGLRMLPEWIQGAHWAFAGLCQGSVSQGGEVGVSVHSPESEQGNNFPGHCPSCVPFCQSFNTFLLPLFRKMSRMHRGENRTLPRVKKMFQHVGDRKAQRQ